MEYNSKNSDYYNIAICMIISRKKFIDWAMYQLNKQIKSIRSAGFKFQIIIDTPFAINIKTNEKHIEVYDSGLYDKIGTKRNIMCIKAKSEIIVMMDDDDFYLPERILVQLQAMKQSGLECASSERPLIMEASTGKVLKCAPKLCESFMTFTKDFWLKQKFGPGKGEGCQFLKGREEDCIITDLVGIVINHDSNTTYRPTEYYNSHINGLKWLDPWELDFIYKNFISIH